MNPLAPVDFTLSNLQAATKYYVRVYLKGEVGAKTHTCINSEERDEQSEEQQSFETSTKSRHSDSNGEGDNTSDGGENIQMSHNHFAQGGHSNETYLAWTACAILLISTLPSEECSNSDGVEATTASAEGEQEFDSHGPYVQGKDKDNREKIVTYTPVSLACVHADVSRSRFFAMEEVSQEHDAPMLTCLVGDPVAAPEGAEAIEEESYKVDLWKLHTKHSILNDPTSLLRNTNLFFAWNDSRFGSDVDIRAEEVAYKRYTHDYKNTRKVWVWRKEIQ